MLPYHLPIETALKYFDARKEEVMYLHLHQEIQEVHGVPLGPVNQTKARSDPASQ